MLGKLSLQCLPTAATLRIFVQLTNLGCPCFVCQIFEHDRNLRQRSACKNLLDHTPWQLHRSDQNAYALLTQLLQICCCYLFYSSYVFPFNSTSLYFTLLCCPIFKFLAVRRNIARFFAFTSFLFAFCWLEAGFLRNHSASIELGCFLKPIRARQWREDLLMLQGRDLHRYLSGGPGECEQGADVGLMSVGFPSTAYEVHEVVYEVQLQHL